MLAVMAHLVLLMGTLFVSIKALLRYSTLNKATLALSFLLLCIPDYNKYNFISVGQGTKLFEAYISQSSGKTYLL